jgi:CubicO group peptidase (beta-lactamase class C family)
MSLEVKFVTENITIIDSDRAAKRLGEIAARFEVRGCSLVIFDGENILANLSYGTAAVRDGETMPVNSDTIYRIASISKMVTALLVMQQVEAGNISLDSPIAELVDPRLCDPAWPDDKATLRHLLSHSAGIIDNKTYTDAVLETPFPSLDYILRGESPFSGYRPGTKYEYTNFGLGLAAAVIEKATGQYFHEYAQKSLFEPMGVDASFLVDELAEKKNIAAMVDHNGVEYDPLRDERFRTSAYGNIPLGQMYLLAHAELFIGVADLAKIAMILAGDGTYNGRRYISEESLKLMHTPYIHVPEMAISRGLAALITDSVVDGLTLYGHQGDAQGAVTSMFYDPLDKKGSVFLSNGANSVRTGYSNICAINREVINMVAELFGR